MKFLNDIGIKIKVIIPISVLAFIILLSSILGMVNSKQLLNAGYDISDNCSASIVYLMEMSSGLQTLENNVNSHCNADNSITKNEYQGIINDKLSEMDTFFEGFEKLPSTDKEKEYYGAMKKKH